MFEPIENDVDIIGRFLTRREIMINFAKKIEKLNKFLLKAITKAIEAGTKIIEVYDNASDEIAKLKIIISKLSEIKKELQSGVHL